MFWTVRHSRKRPSLRWQSRGISLELPRTVCDFHSCLSVTSDPHSTRLCLDCVTSGHQRTKTSFLQFYSAVFPLLWPRRIKIGTSIWTCRWWCQDRAQLLGQPGKLELDSDSDRQPVVLRGLFRQLILKTYLQSPALVPMANRGEPASLHPQTNPQAAFSFQGHSPEPEYTVDGSSDGDREGLGQRQKAWLAFLVV